MPARRASLISSVPLLIGFVLLFIAAVSTAFLAHQQQEIDTRIRHTFQVNDTLERIQTLTTDAESGQRGYLLTNRLAYLDPYNLARRALPQELDTLQSELGGSSTPELTDLRAAAAEKLAELQSTIDLRAANNPAAALAIVNNDSGRRLMDRIHKTLAALHSAQEHLLENRSVEAAQLNASRSTLLLGSVLLVIVLGIGTLLDNRRRVTALQLANNRLQAEATVRRAAETQVRQLQKMEAVGQLTGGIAHDFNNMLAIIVGSLDLARRRLTAGDTGGTGRYITNASEGAQRAAVLTSRLLAFSRKQALEPKVFDANKLVGGMSELLRSTIGEQIQIETVLAGGLWRTFADPAQVETALLNLAVNARDAMPDGGKLTIETANTYLDERYAAAHNEVAVGQYVMVSATDTGAGMAPDVVERAFEPFFSTKGSGRGTGLGLSQVFGFIKQSNGHVKIYSEPGEGTTVKIYLPRYVGAASAFEAEGASSEIPNGHLDEIVLVVEDDPIVKRMSIEALRELGYTVIHAQTPAEALQKFDAHPQIALLFSDIIMPEMTGRELAERLTALRPGLKVLFTTGYTQNAIVHNGIVDPGTAFLPKPFTLDQLARKVRAVIDGKE
ncbi:histidine kinase [Methylovirgula ligni]|uniref:histidine kinase n=1 Tax=Methylovirgula ligni TaxID=569860 RepID=A0A3D9YRK1_9HYPH|nr:CHASE3 domain-containing protein [Methylovirgula ligni]QAY97157.1 histidine kinase [Methylovirgula ligni]REF84688.1 phospho-acceptor domain-containing protein [Methylovirgula ligni]